MLQKEPFPESTVSSMETQPITPRRKNSNDEKNYSLEKHDS